MKKASASNAAVSAQTFEMSSLGINILIVETVETEQEADMEYFIINLKGWVEFFIFISPCLRIKTCLQIEGDAVRRQLQATLLMTKHHLICGNKDTR